MYVCIYVYIHTAHSTLRVYIYIYIHVYMLKRRETYTHAILITIISYIITLLVIITLMIIRDNYFPIFVRDVLCTIQFLWIQNGRVSPPLDFPVRRDCAKKEKGWDTRDVSSHLRTATIIFLLKQASQSCDRIIPRILSHRRSPPIIFYVRNRWVPLIVRLFTTVFFARELGLRHPRLRIAANCQINHKYVE